MSGNSLPTTSPPTQSPRFDPLYLALRVARTGLSYWWIGLIYLALLAALAVLAAVKYTRYTWEARSALLYSSLPIPDQQRDLYSPPDLKTLIGLVTTPRVVDQVCAEFGLEDAARAIERSVELTNPPGTRVLQVRFRWADEKGAREILDRLTELFREQVAELRRQKIEGHLQDYLKTRQESHAHWLEAMQALQKFNQGIGTSDLKQARSHKAEEVLALESALAQAQRNRTNVESQLKQLDLHIQNLKSEATKQAAKEREFQAAEETVADNRRRQDRLRELIADERKLEETRMLLEVRRREQDRLRPLVAKGLKTRGEYDRLQSEIGVLVARISENEKIRAWKQELERIDKVVVPKGASQSLGSPIIQQTLFRRLELQLQLTGIEEEIRQVSRSLEAKRKEIDQLARVQQQAESLAREVEAADTQRQRIDGQIAALRQLESLGSTEFVVVTPATTGSHPLSSNRKLVLAGILGMGGLLGLIGLAGFDFWTFSRSSEGVARSLNLPVVARLPVAASALDTSPAIRGLALALRQYVEKAGGVVVFSPAGQAPQLDRVVRGLADCLVRRDERVLVLDGRLTEAEAGQHPGLSDFLTFAAESLDEVIQSTSTFGVDLLSAGQAVTTGDSLATHRMRELIEQLRQRYTLILLRGPSLQDPVDLSILSAFADALLIVADTPPSSPALAKNTLNSLLTLDAPILGQIIFQRSSR